MTHRLSRGKQPDTQGYGLAQSELPPFEDGRVDPGTWFDRPQLPLQVEIGSCMWQMIQEGVWAEAGDPTTWKDNCAVQLERAYLRFVKWASDTKTDHREEKWNRNKLSMTSTLSKPY